MKQNLLSQLKRYAKNSKLPIIQAASELRGESCADNYDKDIKRSSSKSHLEEFNEIWHVICGDQKSAMEDFIYFKKFLEEIFKNDSVNDLTLKDLPNVGTLQMMTEQWPLKTVFAARVVAILIDVSRTDNDPTKDKSNSI